MSRVCALAFVCAALSGCNADRREAEALVRAYNEAAIVAYRTRSFDDVKKVATQKEWGRVVVLVDLKTANELVLESELQALEITAIEKPNDELLEVSTKERWRYWDRPLKPGAAAGTVFVAQMTLTYDFVREDGAWKLSSARTLTNDYLEPPGFKLHAAARDGGNQ